MLGKLGWRQTLLAAALMLFMSGCYTVVNRTTPIERVTSRTETISQTAPAGDNYVSDDRDGEESEDQYSDNSEDAAEDGAVADLQENRVFGIRTDKYDRSGQEDSERYQDADGKTIINNYYDYPVSGYRYSRNWNDPWDWCATPYYWRPYLRVGIMYDPWDPFYWHDPWSYGFGFGYSSYYWNDPWYYGGGYGWDPWYRYSWNNNYDHDSWHHGGGGGGNGDGGFDSPRRSRSDRLAGFGSGRRTGGEVETARTGENTTSLNGADGTSIRRGSTGSVDTAARRRSSQDVSGVAVEKQAGTAIGGDTGISSRRRSASGDNTGSQRVNSGDTVRRSRVTDDPDNIVDTISRPVRKEGDVRYRWRSSNPAPVRREVTTEPSGNEASSSQEPINTRENVRRRTPARDNRDSGSHNSSATRGNSTESSRDTAKPSISPPVRSGDSGQAVERGRTETSRPAPSAPERSSGTSPGSSYSPPSNGGSSSGGGNSRGGGSSYGGGNSRGGGGGSSSGGGSSRGGGGGGGSSRRR